MARPFDTALKQLIETYPADGMPLAGLRTESAISVIDADIATIAAAADKVLQVQESPPWLLHFELQSSGETRLAERVHWYNALLRHRHGVPVRSVVVLLRRAADSPALTGTFEEHLHSDPAHLIFHYSLVRLWQVPLEAFLQGGLGTLPLAPISDVAESHLPAVVHRIDQRLQQEATPDQAVVLTAASLILTGLRLPRDQTLRLFQGVHFMSIADDSSMGGWFDERGAIREARTLILRLGTKRSGPA